MKNTNEETKAYAHWLHRIDGLGNKTITKLLEICDIKTLFHAPPKEAVKRVLNVTQQKAFFAAFKNRDPLEEYAILKKEKINFTCTLSDDYPSRLLQVHDAPFGLYYKGALPDEAPSVAIIGARICSEYGRYMARQLGTELAAAGVQVISGMALGVDGIAQKGAVAAGGRSFAVLGSGVDVCYPEENRTLYERLPERGGVISEYAPWKQPEAKCFPPRNRIIAGLADAVLVVEARKKSGTLITVDMALEQGKEVFAVPGRVTDRLSDGCNFLIRQGAGIAFSAQDVLDSLYGIGSPVTEEQPDRRKPDLTSLEEALLLIVDIRPVSVNTVYEQLIARGVRATVPTIMNTLIELCFKGYLQQEGGFFMRRITA